MVFPWYNIQFQICNSNRDNSSGLQPRLKLMNSIKQTFGKAGSQCNQRRKVFLLLQPLQCVPIIEYDHVCVCVCWCVCVRLRSCVSVCVCVCVCVSKPYIFNVNLHSLIQFTWMYCDVYPFQVKCPPNWSTQLAAILWKFSLSLPFSIICCWQAYLKGHQ